MFKTLLGGLIGGVAMYLVGFIFWGTPLSALAFNRAESAAGSNLQAALAQALTPSGTGVYVIPDPATAQGTTLYGKGSAATSSYNKDRKSVTAGKRVVVGEIHGG